MKDDCPHCEAEFGGNPWRVDDEFVITPKGVLALALMKVGIMEPSHVEKVWKILAESCDVTMKQPGN